MLKDITSQVKINGFLSEEIIIERGVRQGDPLSAFCLPRIIWDGTSELKIFFNIFT